MTSIEIDGSTKCEQCSRVYEKYSIDSLILKQGGICQICHAKQSGKYSNGQSSAIGSLITAVRGLRHFYDTTNPDFISHADFDKNEVHAYIKMAVNALDGMESGE